MPIYEYRRPDGTTFELMQSFSEPALKQDPETGVKVERVLHAPAVHFKGKGFYNTDYGTRKRQRETAAAGEGSSGGSGSGSDGASGADGSSGSNGAAKDAKGEGKAGGSDTGGGGEKGSTKDSSTAKPKADSKPVAAAK
jgi:putative FmdB family regulatory protein